MLPVMDVSVISLDEDPSLFGGGGARDASSERERRVRVKDGLKKVPEFNSKCTTSCHPFWYLINHLHMSVQRMICGCFCLTVLPALALPDKISAHL